jgi:hypothetical protein
MLIIGFQSLITMYCFKKTKTKTHGSVLSCQLGRGRIEFGGHGGDDPLRQAVIDLLKI